MRKMFVLLTLPLVVLDQWVKGWVYHHFMIGVGCCWVKPPPQKFLPGIGLTYTENTGAAFSIFGNARWILAGISLAAVVAMLVFILIKKRALPLIFAFTLIISGAAGNLIDRLLTGYVVDMFEFTFMRFAIFNVADIYITVGGVFLFLYLVFTQWRGKPAAGSEPHASLETDG